MNKNIINRWNSVVNSDDIVYHLGDVMLGNNQAGMECLKQLNGNIIIVAGNHDTDTRIKIYREAGYQVELAVKLKYHGYHFFMTHFPCLTSNLEVESLKQCTCSLFGHTHQQDNFYNNIPFMYHVGMDSHNCYPVELDTIIKDMKQKINETY